MAEEAAKREKEAQQKAAREREESAERRSQAAAKRAREAQEQAARERLARQSMAEQAAQKAKEAEEAILEAEAIRQAMAEIAERMSKLWVAYEKEFGCKKAWPRAGRKSDAQVPGCTHRMWWPRRYGSEECHFCGRLCSLYTLRCPDCDVRACIPCKIEQTGM